MGEKVVMRISLVQAITTSCMKDPKRELPMGTTHCGYASAGLWVITLRDASNGETDNVVYGVRISSDGYF
jgi:hypothetical protein